MHFFESALSLALLAGSAVAQSMQLTYPPPGSTLTIGSDITVQVGMGSFPENIDVVSTVIGLARCNDGHCSPANSSVGTGSILFQGPYKTQPGYFYENYTVTVPESFPAGKASLNVINLFMVGAGFMPVVDYSNTEVTVVVAK